MDASGEPGGAAPVEVLAIVGPTASGKSALGYRVGEHLRAAGHAVEFIACDSMQVYRGLDIGTAKASPAQRAAWPHHGIDLVAPDQHFDAAAWARFARACLREVRARGARPVIVGGTGLYLRALERGLFDAPPPDPAIRARHRAEAAAVGVAALHARLLRVDPASAARIHAGDLLRISRALELYEQTGVPMSELWARAAAGPRGGGEPPPRLHRWALHPPLEVLRARIAARTAEMLAAGLVDEVRALRAAGHGGARALQAIGYREVGQFLDGALPEAELAAAITRSTVAYARRQRTWFGKEDRRATLLSPEAPLPALP